MFNMLKKEKKQSSKTTVNVQRTADKSTQLDKPKKALPKSKLSFDRFKNRTAIGIACIFIAFIIVFGISPLINNAAKAQTVIVRVDKDIDSGQRITADKIEKVTVGGYNLPKNVAKTTEEVVGKYALEGLKQGDYILYTKVSSDPFFSNPYLYNLPEGKVAMSVTLKSLASGLSGKLQNGDVVSLIAIAGEGGEKKALLLPELTYVEVLAVTTKDGLDSNQQSQEGKTEQDISTTAILSVNPSQALKLAEYEENGKLHVTLVNRGDEAKKQELLEVQEGVFTKKNTESAEGMQEGKVSGE